MRKLQIIFYTKGFERGASEPFVTGPSEADVCH